MKKIYLLILCWALLYKMEVQEKEVMYGSRYLRAIVLVIDLLSEVFKIFEIFVIYSNLESIR